MGLPRPLPGRGGRAEKIRHHISLDHTQPGLFLLVASAWLEEDVVVLGVTSPQHSGVSGCWLPLPLPP